MNDMFVEKYRPKTFDEVVGNKQIIEQLKSITNIEQMPHLLFEGPPGNGKTTCGLILASKFFGQKTNVNFLELNASDERKIDNVRTKIKGFVQSVGLVTSKKIIFLDEADSITQDAQNALRRLMEQYANNCAFILSCNYANKIIAPLKSRCMVCTFEAVENSEMKSKLKYIVEKENINISDEVLDRLISNCRGDLRKGINDLQILSFSGKEITLKDVKNSVIDYDKIFGSGVSFSAIRSYIGKIIDEGVNPRRLLILIRDYVFNNSDIEKSSEILYQLMLADYRIVQGVDFELVLDGLVYKIKK